MAKQLKLGIIQSRGLGDIVIALPIAKHYADQGYQVHWPICEEFLPSVQDHVTWVKWIPLTTDRVGKFFYEEPMKRLKNLNCDEIICLYQNLNVVPELANVPWFQIQKFDEFKYTKAGVPFLKKWSLDECIARDLSKETTLLNELVEDGQPYYVTHFEGSSYTANPDLGHIPPEWKRVDVQAYEGYSIFDWLLTIERAQAVICVDSVIANMIDQLRIGVDKYWIPRSHIHITPVLGMDWTILDAPEDSLAAKPLFKIR